MRSLLDTASGAVRLEEVSPKGLFWEQTEYLFHSITNNLITKFFLVFFMVVGFYRIQASYNFNAHGQFLIFTISKVGHFSNEEGCKALPRPDHGFPISNLLYIFSILNFTVTKICTLFYLFFYSYNICCIKNFIAEDY